VLELIRNTGGAAIAVSTREARSACEVLAREEGLFVCLEAATTLAALRKAMERGLVSPSERIVLVATGSGLKSVPSIPVMTPPSISISALVDQS
jgi:threonine synthase